MDVDKIIDKYGGKRRYLIAILQDVQEEERYLPKEALCRVAERLGMPLVDVFGVATFYSAFSLVPRGRHEVTVCVGTACHVRGSRRILEEFERRIGVRAGCTTEDLEFTLETVNCLGCCAIGPVVVVDKAYNGEMTTGRVKGIVDRCREAAKVEAS
ncbi:MAG: NAD(P)H-dependent oxidoreductase subunit E [candidate division WOR-3 bacterium]|nr:MAG: NAD(P)H-dependent oxidoreductase subunit E [candidate division WOR-3 bacterium]